MHITEIMRTKRHKLNVCLIDSLEHLMQKNEPNAPAIWHVIASISIDFMDKLKRLTETIPMKLTTVTIPSL